MRCATPGSYRKRALIEIVVEKMHPHGDMVTFVTDTVMSGGISPFLFIAFPSGRIRPAPIRPAHPARSIESPNDSVQGSFEFQGICRA